MGEVATRVTHTVQQMPLQARGQRRWVTLQSTNQQPQRGCSLQEIGVGERFTTFRLAWSGTTGLNERERDSKPTAVNITHK